MPKAARSGAAVAALSCGRSSALQIGEAIEASVVGDEGEPKTTRLAEVSAVVIRVHRVYLTSRRAQLRC